MIGKQNLEHLSQKAIKEGLRLGATQVEVVLWSETEELTRFANNEIHQSVSLSDVTVHVRAVVGKKIGVARGNAAGTTELMGIVRNSVEIAKAQREDKHFKSLPTPARYRDFSKAFERSFHLGSKGRAEAVRTVINRGNKSKLITSGAFSESESEILVANSLGVLAYHQGKSAEMSVIATGSFGSG